MAVTNPYMIFAGGTILGAFLQLMWLPPMLAHYGDLRKATMYSVFLAIGTGLLIGILGAVFS